MHPFFFYTWDGSGCHGYSKVITVFRGGVNMQDDSHLQDGLAEMMSLDTDLRSVLAVFILGV